MDEIRTKYINYFKKNEHEVIPSASLLPENDPTTLFTGSGMQPLVPYLLGNTHPKGSRLVNSQKCYRAVDIDDVGDNRHTTFFEMLGNWSLGDYFKKEQLQFFFNFLIEEVGLDPKKIFVTAFIGDSKSGIPKDTEVGEIWKELFKKHNIEAKEQDMPSLQDASKIGVNDSRIFYYKEKNWWSRSGVPEKMPVNEPGGPDSEVFYEFSDIEHDSKYGEKCHPNCDCGRYLEIGNSVFMQYIKDSNGEFKSLPKKNVDFGGGLERILMVKNNNPDIFEIDTLKKCINILEEYSDKQYNDELSKKSFRVIIDHMRSSVFLLSNGVKIGNSDRGYFVRRMLRRVIFHLDKINAQTEAIYKVLESIIESYKNIYPEVLENKSSIIESIKSEEERFRKTLKNGLKEFEKIDENLTGQDIFYLFSSYGFPMEMTEEISKEKNKPLSIEAISDFKKLLKEHQDRSRSGSLNKFKGGLGDDSEKTVRYHTATHLLNAGLRKVLGNHVSQRGSNITQERLRFDFLHDQKMTDDEKKAVVDFVNECIKKECEIQKKEMPKEEALKIGAVHAFDEKYPDIVTIYEIVDRDKNVISREFCGGPHVKNTKELLNNDGAANFKIIKEEAVAKGIRRIKAVL